MPRSRPLRVFASTATTMTFIGLVLGAGLTCHVAAQMSADEALRQLAEKEGRTHVRPEVTIAAYTDDLPDPAALAELDEGELRIVAVGLSQRVRAMAQEIATLQDELETLQQDVQLSAPASSWLVTVTSVTPHSAEDIRNELLEARKRLNDLGLTSALSTARRRAETVENSRHTVVRNGRAVKKDSYSHDQKLAARARLRTLENEHRGRLRQVQTLERRLAMASRLRQIDGMTSEGQAVRLNVDEAVQQQIQPGRSFHVAGVASDSGSRVTIEVASIVPADN